MSADNGLIIDLKTFEVIYYQGDGEDDAIKCKTLEEAVLKAQELDEEYQTEYGINFINQLKVK
jgi:hypothetical protein